MPTTLPTRGHRQPVVFVNADGTPATISATITDVSPGATITTPADTVVGIGATVALPTSTNVRRQVVQNTGGAGTRVRVREVAAGAGRGVILPSLSSRFYGEMGGAIAALEVEEVAGIATTVCSQFERD